MFCPKSKENQTQKPPLARRFLYTNLSNPVTRVGRFHKIHWLAYSDAFRTLDWNRY